MVPPVASLDWARGPTNGRRYPAPGFDGFDFENTSDQIDSACLKKRIPGIFRVLGNFGHGVAEKEAAQTLLGRLQSGPRRIRSFGEFPGTGRLLTSRHLRGRVGAVIKLPHAWRRSLGLQAKLSDLSSDRSLCSTRSSSSACSVVSSGPALQASLWPSDHISPH